MRRATGPQGCSQEFSKGGTASAASPYSGGSRSTMSPPPPPRIFFFYQFWRHFEAHEMCIFDMSKDQY